MYVSELAARLSPGEKQAFLAHGRIWAYANGRGMSWEQAVTDRNALQGAVRTLSPYGRTALELLLKRYGFSAAGEEQLLKAGTNAGLLSGIELRAGVRELRAAGIVFAVSKVWGERLLFVPRDALPFMLPAVFPFRAEQWEHGPEGAWQAEGEPGKLLGRQLLAGLAELARCGTSLTAKGTLPKKVIGKLAQAMGLREETLRTLQAKAAYGLEYSLPVALLLHAALKLGLLEKSEQRYDWHRDELADWLVLPAAVRESRLYSWLAGELLGSSPAIALGAAAASNLEKDCWYREEAIVQWQFHDLRLEETSEVDKTGLECWFSLLQQCGWLERARSADGGMLFRWLVSPLGPQLATPLAAIGQDASSAREDVPQAHAKLQQNGEIVVFPECPFRLRWELELAADRTLDDSVTVYRMDGGTIARAVRNGRTAAQLAQLLKETGGGSVPEHLLDYVERAARQACLAQLEEALLLKCADKETADAIGRDNAIAATLKERLGDTHFIVDKALTGELRKRMEQAGFPPLMRLAGTEEADGENGRYPLPAYTVEAAPVDGMPSYAERPGMLYDAGSVSMYPLEAILSEGLPALLPNTDKVPAMWLSQLRAYHHSTRKEMLERAVEWQTPVQLRLEQGLMSFVPERLEQDSGGWAVTGILRDSDKRTPVRLTPDMWKEMKLLVPE